MSHNVRWLTMLALAILAFGVLAACTPNPPPAPTSVPPTTGPAASSAPSGTAAQPSAAATGRLEVFSSWATGPEAAGLLNLYDIYKKDHANVEVVNATVAGGAGSNAKAVLKTRMLGGNAPDSFQIHMGQELIDTWVIVNYIDNLDDLYKSEGWDKAFPKGALDILSFDGHYWSVPTDVQRANVLWYNKKVFADNNLQPPKTFDDFFKAADTLKANGVIPLALGDNANPALLELWETTLIGTMGPDKYKGLWTGGTDWKGPEVKQSLDTMKKMFSYVNSDHSTLSWQQANDLVLSGKAAMTIMGDWVNSDNIAKKQPDAEGWALAPGNTGVFDALSDTFALPKQAKDRQNAIEWLKLVGSKPGQEAFNPVKGSSCARTDCDKSLFDPYLQSVMQDWTKDTVVPSLAYGAAAGEGWLTAINGVMSAFVSKQDVAAAQTGLIQACLDAKVCK